MKETLQDRILKIQNEFTPSEQRLADVVLARLSQLASYSATELAEIADVSKASAARFFKRLGYETFADLRVQMREDADHGSPLYTLAGISDLNSFNENDRNLLNAHLTTEVQNLAHTYEHIKPTDIEAAVKMSRSARRVFVVGFRNGRVLAQYMWALLSQIRDNVLLVPGAGLSLAEDLANLSAEDVVIVMDFRRRVTLLRPVVEHANNVGACVIILTDPTATELPARGDIVLRCVNRTSGMFDSYIAAMSLINHLCTRLGLALGDAALARLAQIETLHTEYGDLRN